jgi:hypothetical protein
MATQLAASQEGLSSVSKEVSKYVTYYGGTFDAIVCANVSEYELNKGQQDDNSKTLSLVLVTKDGVRIDNWIYYSPTGCNYK